MSFDDDKLGVEEFLTEKEKRAAGGKAEAKVCEEDDSRGGRRSEPKSSTAASQIAKKLTRLALGALLADVALSQAAGEGGEKQCPPLQVNRGEVIRLESIIMFLYLVILALIAGVCMLSGILWKIARELS